MNKQRRKLLGKLAERIEEIKNDLELARDEEQEYFDNMPESMQYGDKGSAVEETITQLDDALQSLEDAVDNINSSIEN